MKRKSRLRQFTDRLGRDAQIETFESMLLQLNADGELTVHGVSDVLFCTPEQIVFESAGVRFCLTGEGLRFLSFSPQETAVAGEIRKIELIRGDEKTC